MNYSTRTLVDIGANLTHESFEHDRAEVIERARDAGVGQIILTGSDGESNLHAARLAEQYPQLYATAGFHPHHANQFDEQTFELIQRLLGEDNVKALGEIGLDFYRNLAEPSNQEKVFTRLLELGCAQQMPLFLHERDAHKRMYEILRSHQNSLPPFVIHCFTGDKSALSNYLSLGAHIGITGWICDERRGTHLRELVKHIPTDKLMIETDAPYLLPRDLPKDQLIEKHRNEPVYLTHIAERIAHYLDCDSNTLAAQTSATSKKFFGLD